MRAAMYAEPSLQAALPATPDQGTRQRERGHPLGRIVGLLRRTLTAGASYHDPFFMGPDVVEDDYYRFRHQPRGW